MHLDSTPCSTICSLCDLGQVSNLSGSNIIPPIYCREISIEAEFSVHFELFSSSPTSSLHQSGRGCYLFGGRAAIFLGGGSLAGCAPEFLSGFAARVNHPSDSTILVPPPGSPSRTPAFGSIRHLFPALARVWALILWGRRLHQPHIVAAFLHPRENPVFATRVPGSQAGCLPLPWPTVNPSSWKGCYQRSLGVVSVGT